MWNIRILWFQEVLIFLSFLGFLQIVDNHDTKKCHRSHGLPSLLRFGVQKSTQCILFIVFLVIYVTSMVGNTRMILLINTDSRLQTPLPSVLLIKSGFCWYLLYICHHSQDATERHGRRLFYIICRMCNTIVGLCHICNQWLLPPWCFGSGQVCSNL